MSARRYTAFVTKLVAALTVGMRRSGILVALLALPLYVPVLVFGAGAVAVAAQGLDATAPFTFKQEGANGIFDGAFVLKRADYAIGEGMWADFGTVANEIQIKFHVVAAAAAAAKK